MDESTQRFAVIFRGLRALRRIALWGALALFVLLLTALAINAFDERPSREALALLQPPEIHYRPDENIYVALAGFEAPPGQSVVAAGQAAIAHYDERLNGMLEDPLSALEMFSAADPAKLKFKGSVDCCRPREPSFWGSVHANASKIEQLVDQNGELYERYLALFGLSGYYETARPSYLAPIYMALTDIRTLFLAKISLRLQSGDLVQTQEALKSLRQDIELSRRLLTGEGTLISKMVAVSYLQTDSLILSDMIADSRTQIPQNMEEFLPDFDSSQWNIGSTFASEFRVMAVQLRQTQALIDNHWQPPDSTSSSVARAWNRVISPIEGQFFKINATENLYAKLLNEVTEMADLNPSTFKSNQARLKEWERNSEDLWSVRTVYNPIGKVLVAIAAPAYNNYVLRPYDAAALQRLVRLSFEIRRQQIAPPAIAAFMKLHPEWSTHPADGRPFVWKPASGEIAIQPVALQPADRRFAVLIWRTSGGSAQPRPAARAPPVGSHIQIAKHLGAGKVIATGRSLTDDLRALGADETLQLTDDRDFLGETFKQVFREGIDIVLDYLWGRQGSLPLDLQHGRT